MFHVEHSQFGVYVHVPFCLSKCGYCDFCRVTNLELCDDYIKVISKEMSESDKAGLAPRTVYVGGGTPSCIGVDRLQWLLQLVRANFDLGQVEEWTVECNPEDVTPALANMLVGEGVNRVSMGAQSLNDNMLKMMGRRHKAGRVYEAIDTLRKAGINNISVDCIFGLPQCEDYDPAWDFRKFAALGVEHLSAYSLQYEEGSRFTRMIDNGTLTPATEDETVAQYDELTSILAKAGYEHYEISNYAKPGLRAVHNSSYWTRVPYEGFGPGASSMTIADGKMVRTTNTSDVEKYISSLGKEKELVEKLSDSDVAEEVVMLSLRIDKGMDVSEVPTKFREKMKAAVDEEMKIGNLVKAADGRVRIPEDRWMVSQKIMVTLMEAVCDEED